MRGSRQPSVVRRRLFGYHVARNLSFAQRRIFETCFEVAVRPPANIRNTWFVTPHSPSDGYSGRVQSRHPSADESILGALFILQQTNSVRGVLRFRLLSLQATFYGNVSVPYSLIGLMPFGGRPHRSPRTAPCSHPRMYGGCFGCK